MVCATITSGAKPRNAFWDKQTTPYRTFVDWLRGPDLQLAVEAAVLRTDDSTQLDQLSTVHDILDRVAFVRMTHDSAPPLLAVAAVLLARNLIRRRRNGNPVPLLPRSTPARAVAVAVVALVVVSGVLAGQPWVASIVPAVALGGLAGAVVDLRYRSRR
ncbi:hypothetical protein ACWC9T_20425 [Kitasatospora sp. NPDC001159]